MKMRRFFQSLPLLLNPALVQASDNVEHGSSAILCLQQLSDLSSEQLPQDILNVLGQALTKLDRHGVWLREGADKKWIPFTKIVEKMQSFRDAESSEAEIRFILEGKEQITEGLLLAVSAEWQKSLDNVLNKHRQADGSWHAGKAYGSAFIAYYTVVLSAAMYASWDAALEASIQGDRGAAWDTAFGAARDDARDATSEAAWEAVCSVAVAAAYAGTKEAFYKALHPLVKQKLASLGPHSAYQLGVISYDLAELFSFLWLIDRGHEYLKKAFEAAYETYPATEITEIKALIKASIDEATNDNPELEENQFIKVLWRDLDVLEKQLLAK